jgi:hypothetical protein
LGDAQWYSAASLGTPKNRIFATNTDMAHAITARYYLGGAIGDWVCMAGGWSSRMCGYITMTGVAVDISDPETGEHHVHWQNNADYSTSPGDSGGPVYFGSTAYGIHSGFGSQGANFSEIGLVEDALAVKVCQNDACTYP